MRNTRTYYFARLNLLAASAIEGKARYVRDSLQKRGIVVRDRGTLWGFLDVAEVRKESNEYMLGNLTRYTETDEEMIANPSDGVTDTTRIDNRVHAQVKFFIDPKTGLLAFHLDAGITVSMFMKVFAMLIEEANERLFVSADVQLIQEEGEILKVIKSLDRIDRLSITLHPSNPKWRHLWKSTDEKLQDMGVQVYRQDYRSERGLTIDEDKPAYNDILMAGDGYGVAIVYGEKDGKRRRASTTEVPLTIQTDADLTDAQALGILEKDGFTVIGERIDGDEKAKH